MDENILPIGIKYKEPAASERTLLISVDQYKCLHRQFIVDEKMAEVTCAECKEKINPMHALAYLAREESRWNEHHRQYQDELKRLAERSRTKCQCCGNMTRISHS